MPAWPGAREAIAALRTRYIVAPLTILISRWRWAHRAATASTGTASFPATFSASTSPTRVAFERATEIVRRHPKDIMMVAAHPSDLRAGMKAGYGRLTYCRGSRIRRGLHRYRLRGGVRHRGARLRRPRPKARRGLTVRQAFRNPAYTSSSVRLRMAKSSAISSLVMMNGGASTIACRAACRSTRSSAPGAPPAPTRPGLKPTASRGLVGDHLERSHQPTPRASPTIG